MAQIAGLQDFIQQGPPADTGTFQFLGEALVFRHTFAGTTYVCALRAGERGWVLISLLPETNANSLTAIQAALNSLTAGRTWQEKVIVRGHYTVNGTIDIPSYTVFELQGSITLAAASNVNLIEAATTPASHIVMVGGYYDGGGADQTGDMSTIYMEEVDNSKFLDFYVTGGFRDSTARGEGLELYNSDNNVVNGIHAFSNQYDGIKMRAGSQYNTVMNCVCWDNWASGVQNATNAQRNSIVGNIVWTTARASNPLAPYCRGFTVHSSEGSTIADNIIYNVNRAILFIVDGNEETSDNVVEGNTILASEYGFYFTMTGDPNEVYHNVFSDNVIHTIDEEGLHTANCHLKFNVFDDNVFYNMNIGISFAGANITENDITDNYFHTITLDGIVFTTAGALNTIKGNHIHTAGDNGISIESAAADNTFIIENWIYNCGENGIELVSGANQCPICDNYILSNGTTVGTWHGIHLNGNLECNIQGNTIIDNDTDGIFLEGVSERNFLDGNLCTDNGRYGINISAGTCDDNRIGTNMLQGNTTGALNDASIDNTHYANEIQYLMNVSANLDTTSTEYFSISGRGGPTAAESYAVQEIRKPGTFRHSRVQMDGPAGAGDSYVFTFRRDRGNQAITMTITGAAQIMEEDNINSVHVDAGHEVSWGCNPAGNPTAENCWITICFIPDQDA